MLEKQYQTVVWRMMLVSAINISISHEEILNTTNKIEFAKIENCVLCAACDSTTALRNKSNTICTLQEDVQHLNKSNFSIAEECYKLGDYSELICTSRSNIIYTHVSILPPSKGSKYCKFNISYYDVSKKSYVPNDILFVMFGTSNNSNAEMKSYNGTWKVVHKKDYKKTSIYGSKNFEFDIVSLTGKDSFLYLFKHSENSIKSQSFV